MRLCGCKSTADDVFVTDAGSLSGTFIPLPVPRLPLPGQTTPTMRQTLVRQFGRAAEGWFSSDRGEISATDLALPSWSASCSVFPRLCREPPNPVPKTGYPQTGIDITANADGWDRVAGTTSRHTSDSNLRGGGDGRCSGKAHIVHHRRVLWALRPTRPTAVYRARGIRDKWPSAWCREQQFVQGFSGADITPNGVNYGMADCAVYFLSDRRTPSVFAVLAAWPTKYLA